MSDKVKKNIRLIYNCLLSVMLIVTGILLMTACVRVYKIGDRPFTPENISAAFAKISFIVWITLAMTVIAIILALAMPSEKEKLCGATDKKTVLKRLLSRLNIEKLNEDTLHNIEKEKKLRLCFRLGAITLSLAAIAPALVYTLNMNNYTADYNESVLLSCIWILPTSFFAMGISFIYVILENRSIERQLKFVKEAFSDSSVRLPSKKSEAARAYPKAVLGVRISIAVIAVLFIALGIANGGMADVLSKAINICTECIGLG